MSNILSQNQASIPPNISEQPAGGASRLAPERRSISARRPNKASRPANVQPTVKRNKLAAALDLVRRGFFVFPIVPNKKTPAITEWEQRATNDPIQIGEWWSENADYNIGVAAGPSGLTIVDIDTKRNSHGLDGFDTWQRYLTAHAHLGEKWTPTFAVKTQSGGTHLYTRGESRNTQGSHGGIGRGVDTRGGGGYVVGPGSTIDGNEYVIVNNVEPVPTPEWLLKSLKSSHRQVHENAGQRVIEETERAVAAAEDYIENHAPEAIQGDGGDLTTYKVATRLFDFGVSRDTAMGLMMGYNETKALPVWDYEDLERIVDSALRNRQNPIGLRSPDYNPGFEGIDFTEGMDDAPGAPPGGSDDWPEPADLWRETSKPAELPPGVVPEIVEQLARDKGRRLGVEPGAVAAALITALSSLVPAQNRLQVRQLDTGWQVHPTIWGALVGDPGTNKSATLSYAMEAVASVEKTWRAEFASAKRNAAHQEALPKEAEPTVADATSNGVFDGATHGETIERAPPAIPFRQKMVKDATTEAIGLLLEENQSGLIYYADELSGWLGGMDAYRAKAGKDRPFWLQAKDGGPYTINRRTSKTIDIPTLAVGVLGSIQPDKIRALAPNLDDDGLLQRFMPILIHRTGRGVDAAPDAELEAKRDQLALLLTESEQRRLFKFAAEAAGELETIEDFKDREINRPNAQLVLRQWLDKVPSEYARVALVFHFIEHYGAQTGKADVEPASDLVSQETAMRARRFLTEFVYPHAQQFYSRILGTPATDEHAAWVAEYILSRERETIDERELYRAYGPFKRQDRRGDIQVVMYALEMLGWLKPTGPGRQGKPNRWRINPAVHDGRFGERAHSERERRTAARLAIERTGAERLEAATSPPGG